MTDAPKAPFDHARIINSATGEEHDFTPRAPITYLKNGNRLNDYIMFNVRAWKAMAGLLIALAAIVSTIHATMVYVYEPRLRQTIEEQVHPLMLELAAQRQVMQSHLLDEAKASGESVRRQELEEKMSRIEEKIDALYRRNR